MKKIDVFMNKSVYLGLSTWEISKIVMHEFWYDYVKSEHGKKSRTVSYGYSKLCDVHKNKRHLRGHCRSCWN